MRFLAQLYYLLVKRMDYSRFNTPGKFDTLYTLDDDPFNVATSNYEQRKFDDLLHVLGHRRFKHTLDLGCGPGIMTARFAAYSDRITALDFSAKALELARQNCHHCTNVTFQQADVTTFVSNDKYDLFLCSEVLYYLSPDGFQRLISHIRQMAAPEAELVAICRMDDERVRNELEKSFVLLGERKSEKWLRPYVIYRFGVRPIAN